MNENTTTTKLKDYKPSAFLIKSVHLTFKLSPKNTKVHARIVFSPKKAGQDLELDGIDLKPKRLSIDGNKLELESLVFKSGGLTIPKKLIPKSDFIWEAETNISPEGNTALEGLYLSAGTYCTQCEAQGFRKITYFLDRPDIMAVYTVRIEGSTKVLLSNGNLISTGEGYAEWHDPWPKPSYLFALVAGDLDSINEKFLTRSGRLVELKIFVKPKDIDKCSYAMDALKRAMRWDEDTYKREYDLDLFMIVAIDDFNMGAMENKGLNIFNSKYILADKKTATDRDYDNIERIIAHEYFHNWTGNRITCRDWFQLCLKEGLTVFRDQQFSATMRGFTLKRIEDVLTLQANQFREDDGPLAHPVRPQKYLEINNFYTATVYEKGAEVVRMLQIIVGSECYDTAVQNYFVTYDGQACTIEDWLNVFEHASKMNLKQFALWYSQKGRPRVEVSSSYEQGTLTMEFSQELTSNQDQVPKPMLIPMIIGLLDQDGTEILKSKTFFISKKKQIITFDNLPSRPIPSILRDFSAPITLVQPMLANDLYILGEHDTNLFNRWSALRRLSYEAIEDIMYNESVIPNRLLSCIKKIIYSTEFSHSFRALIATAPSSEEVFTYLSSKSRTVDPLAVHKSINLFNTGLAKECGNFLSKFLNSNELYINFEPTGEQAGVRALKLKLLDLLCYRDQGIPAVKNMYKTASNMTDEIGALSLLIKHDKVNNEIDHFYEKWKQDNNVLDKWFAAQVSHTSAQKSVQLVADLTKHVAFELKNPNRFRSVIGAFGANNVCGFHRQDGKGYDIVVDWLIKLDAINPQTTARICTIFDNLKIFDQARRAKMKKSLKRISNLPNLSKNTQEIVDALLKK